MADQDAYEQWADGKIREINAKIEELKAKAQQADADARIEADSLVAEFKRQRQEIGSRLENFKDSGRAAFEEIKGGTENALNDLKASVDRALSKFS
jgi:hypothetical protein